MTAKSASLSSLSFFCSDGCCLRSRAIVAEFYALATSIEATGTKEDKERYRFAQIDTSKNEMPPDTPLADKGGAALLLYGLGEAGEVVPARDRMRVAGCRDDRRRDIRWCAMSEHLRFSED